MYVKVNVIFPFLNIITYTKTVKFQGFKKFNIKNSRIYMIYVWMVIVYFIRILRVLVSAVTRTGYKRYSFPTGPLSKVYFLGSRVLAQTSSFIIIKSRGKVHFWALNSSFVF